MSWLQSILIGLITAAFGCVGAGFVATKCVRWYRISSFEGGSGYFVIGIALLGIIAGLVVGIVASRIVAASELPGFARGLGVAVGSAGMLALTAGFFAWLGADLNPTVDGQSLELAIEVRTPEGFVLPTQLDQYGAFATVYVPRGRSQPQRELKLNEATQRDGRWIVTATLPLRTSAADKYLRAYFTREADAMFALRVPRRPSEKDFNWSGWVDSGWDVGQKQPPPEKRFNLRYRLQRVVPPPPGPTREEIEAAAAAEEQAKFEAIAPDAPIPEWLPYTRYGTAEDRVAIAIEAITTRDDFVAELAPLFTADDTTIATDALRVIEHLPQPPATLNAPVASAGRALAERIRRVNETTVDQDPSYLGAADISLRFSAWMVAVRALRAKTAGDFTPELREILELARVRSDSYVMRVDVVRVASFYMHEWTGLPPLPSDPPPR